jgi:hypothetical protein
MSISHLNLPFPIPFFKYKNSHLSFIFIPTNGRRIVTTPYTAPLFCPLAAALGRLLLVAAQICLFFLGHRWIPSLAV